ncbi:hypothetical protein N3Z17_07425 (plasmid) [Candidatus Bandiella numerosa]|uniref:hypothetical protein n=1 Tax=Candidatus Bandiella numerosa TaxID=2570586 RepID=UPI00249ED4D3|nr:hypothetical protein [Candidatus Bandiella numerosa]WHA05662.1 hypothetical protein N3Z17_07425 [Candidatus Bandiella numerosa]
MVVNKNNKIGKKMFKLQLKDILKGWDDGDSKKPVGLVAIQYLGILLIAVITALMIGKFVADSFGSGKFKYEYFYIAIINLIIGCALFDIGVGKNKLAKIIGLVGLYLLLYVAVISGLLPTSIEGYYIASYKVVSIRYAAIIGVLGLILGSYYIRNAWRYVASTILIMVLAYFIAMRVGLGFILDIAALPVILSSIPALIVSKEKGEGKYRFAHKFFLPYIASLLAFLVLRPFGLTGSDYVIEPCAISIAIIGLFYGEYIRVKYRRKAPLKFYKLLMLVFLLSLIIRSTLTILRSGWV